MATSPIYNWPEPDNTDLVRNGALAIRTMGNAIDTTMATMVAKTIVDAKGDLIAGTAADTAARLAVGANGETLVADSSTSTGLRYQTGVSLNGVINGAMDIWQRGTSFASTGNIIFTADRWGTLRQALGLTVTRQTASLEGFQYSLRAQRDSGNTAVNPNYVFYNMETNDSVRYANKPVTLSFWAKAGANYSSASSALSVQWTTGTGTDQSIINGYTGSSNVVAISNVTLTTSWQRFSFTATAASNTNEMGVIFSNISVGTAGANDWFEVTGVQIELGSVATNFKRAGGGTIQGELAACKYYYKRITGGSSNGSFTNFGTASSTTQVTTTYADTSPMRVTPTSIDSANVAVSDINNARINASSVTIDTTFSTSSTFVLNFAVTGATQYRPYTTLSQIGSTGYIGLSAEL